MGDSQLVERALAGERAAFETLIRRWSPRLLGYVRGLVRCGNVAEDIAQDSLLRAYRQLGSLEKPDRFGPWLLSIAHHLVLDWRKAKARTEVLTPATDDIFSRKGPSLDARTDDPVWLYEQREEWQTLVGLIDTLPEELRQVLLIYYYDEVTYADIADMLGVSKATVNTRLARARTMLRTLMSGTRSDR